MNFAPLIIEFKFLVYSRQTLLSVTNHTFHSANLSRILQVGNSVKQEEVSGNIVLSFYLWWVYACQIKSLLETTQKVWNRSLTYCIQASLVPDIWGTDKFLTGDARAGLHNCFYWVISSTQPLCFMWQLFRLMTLTEPFVSVRGLWHAFR